MRLPSPSSCSLRGVFTLSSICAASNTLPFSVLSPTARTFMIPCPSITFVPLIAWLDGKVASGSNSALSVVLWHIGSPVRVDSSMLSDTASSSSPSAGTSSPVFRITMSPTTTSFFAICMALPLRITCTGSSSFT